MKTIQRLLLLSILLYALIVRLPGIAWGMGTFDQYVVGDARYHPDEFKITVGAKNFPKDILSRTDLRYPTAFHYLIGIIGFPIKIVKTGMNDFQLYTSLGRLISVILGVAGVYLTYHLTRKLTNINAGLIAAALLAISLDHVRESSLSTTDAAMSFWAMLVLLIAAKITPNTGWKTYLGLGLTFGILIGTKYSGAFVLIALAIGVIYIIRHAPSLNLRKMILLIGLFGIVGLITFFLTTPSIIFNPGAFFSSLGYESQRVGRLRSPLWDFSFFSFFFSSLTKASNPFISIAVIGALLWAAIKRPNIHLVAYAIFILLYYAYFNTAFAARYWMLTLPSACVLTGWWLENASASSNKMLKFAAIGLFTLCIATGVYQNVQLERLLLNDTRSTAAQFIAGLPKDATFLLSLNSQKADGWQYPSTHQTTVKDVSQNPDYIVLSDLADQLPLNDILDVKINNENRRYQKIAVFEPVENLKVDFLSPVIQIFKIETQK